jgi:hypothetical protein
MAMNNPRTRDDDQRSSIANQKAQQRSQKEGPAAYAPLPDEQSSADEARERREKAARRDKQGR